MTKVILTTSTWSDMPGTVQEIVDRHLAQGWEKAPQQRLDSVVLVHPGLTGTTTQVCYNDGTGQ